ncbi:MAG: hypothetical protein GX616_18570, partial [Planctomycetes bacterium]|nr:hypothetical protein [Planctomycetota bacterium]
MNTQHKCRTMMLLTLTGAMLASAVPAAAADVIYGPVYSPDNSHIYYVLSPADYYSAAIKAVEMGGYLVKIDDEDENRWVEYTFAGFGLDANAYRWIGANDLYLEGFWQAYDGETPLPYADWNPGEPSNGSGVENCAHFLPGPGGKWNDLPCNWVGYGIVEADDCNADGEPDSIGFYGLLTSYNQYLPRDYFHGERREPNVNFNWWRSGSPGYGIDPNLVFDVGFNGFLRPDKTEHYTIFLKLGGRGILSLQDPVSGQWIVDLDTYSTAQATVSLVAGRRYLFNIWYESFGSPGNIRVEWLSPSTPRQVIPQSAFVAADADCNNNFIGDECDIAEDPTRDCDGNGRLDECELADHDCNSNGVLDACDVLAGTSTDCDGNGTPDECELAGHDCNNNGIFDACEITAETAHDCNNNGVPDACDIVSGLVQCPIDVANACLLDDPAARADCNNNGITD